MRDLSKKIENKKINYQKLKKFGFTKNKNIYYFEKSINHNEFTVTIEISDKKQISKVIDKESNEEYILVDTDSTGFFVGQIKDQYEQIIKDFIDNCTEPNVFKNKKSKHIIKYVKEKYNTDLEFLWEQYPTFAVLRNKESNKWYGMLGIIKESSLGLESNKTTEIINVKYQKEETIKIVNNKTVFPAYHMNKKSWITIKLDEDINIKRIEELIDNSYNLLNKKGGKDEN